MAEFWDSVRDTLGRLDGRSVADIAIIAALFYWLLLLVRGTTAMTLLRGAAILIIVAVVLAQAFNLQVLDFIIRNSFAGLLVGAIVIFQPEIRRALERVGRAGLRAWQGKYLYDETISALSDAAAHLAQRRHGALIVLERDTGLQDYIDTGVRVDAAPSPQLLEGIFYPNSPLHDGAVILREDRVVAAGCTLPVSDVSAVGHSGMRHRAALGISERTDAISVVVSEETGDISLASDGRMVSHLDEPRLKATLLSLLRAADDHRDRERVEA